jgi:threonine aldolase
VNAPVETNIVAFEVQGTDEQVADLEARLTRAGVRVKPVGRRRFRAVTHTSLSRNDIDFCASTLVEAITAATGQ